MKNFSLFTKLAFILLVLGSVSVVLAQQDNYRQQARQILKATNTKGGLIVHIGCGDGKLTAALFVDESFLVHGLEKEVNKLQQARQYVQSMGNYGRVSFSLFDGKRLPYIDNLVNLAVVEEGGDLSMDEIMRVLAPGGKAYINRDFPYIFS